MGLGGDGGETGVWTETSDAGDGSGAVGELGAGDAGGFEHRDEEIRDLLFRVGAGFGRKRDVLAGRELAAAVAA